MDLEAPTTHDLEKSPEAIDVFDDADSSGISSPHLIPAEGRIARWNNRIESIAGFEARGITRVQPEERHPASTVAMMQMALLWFSMNIVANNLAVGLLGPLVYELGFTDSALCSVFGAFVGSLSTAYMSTWGAQSGNRTMVGSPAVIQSLHNLTAGDTVIYLDQNLQF